jgi:uncharacterized protein YdeI (YjbR/CyaY-like superfamily)
MATRKDNPTYFATAALFRGWLEKNHDRESELLVGFYKKKSGRPSMTWPESVDEALCFGWIDGVRRSLGEDAYTIRFTPRKPKSIWSVVNVAKVEALERAGKMHESGQRAFALRSDARTGVYAFEQSEAAVLPPAFDKKLRANRKAAAFFDAQPPYYRRTTLHWIVRAKREETRERRLEQLIEASAAGRFAGPAAASPKLRVSSDPRRGRRTGSGPSGRRRS